MLRPTRFFTALAACLLLIGSAHAQTAPIDQVRDALTAQDTWLATQKTGAGWNDYLQTAELKEQLAKGDDADVLAVRRILSKYQAPVPGVRSPRLASTQRALAAWAKELGQPDRSELPALVRQAKESFQPVAKADVLSRQAGAEAAVRRLDKYLRAAGKNGEAWREYLQMDKLTAEVQKGLEARPDQLRAWRSRLESGLEGLELAQFTAVPEALRPYADLLAAYQNTDAKPQYEQDLEALAAQLDGAVKKPEELNRRELGQLIGRLKASGQSPELMQLVWQEFAEPNLLVKAAAEVVTAGIGDSVDENTPIRDTIMGTSITGRGRTKGVVTAALVPNNDRAQLAITMRGTTTSKNVGRNGPATIFTSATTSLFGTKQVFMDDIGFLVLPSKATCNTNSTITGLNVSGGAIVQRQASSRVYGSRASAQQIASRHAEDRLEGRMDSKTGSMLSNANKSYHDRFRNPLLRRGAFPQVFDFSTTVDWLTIVGLQARPGELAATAPPPEASADAKLSIRAHESLIENMAQVMLAGETTRDEDFKRFMRNMHGGKLPEDEFKILLRNMTEEPPVETYKQFSGLLKDRAEKAITVQEFDALVRALRDRQASQKQLDAFLAPLAANTLTAERVNEMLKDLPEPSQGSLTFADNEPITVRFRNDTVTITLHSTGHTSSEGVERTIEMDITASYKFDWKGGALVAKRQGAIDVSPPGFKPGTGKGELGARQVTARRTLERRFERIFKPEMESTGLTLRGRWKKLGELPWTQMDVKDGWVAAGFKVAEEQSTAERTSMNPDVRNN